MLEAVLRHLEALVSFDTRNPPRAIGSDGIFAAQSSACCWSSIWPIGGSTNSVSAPCAKASAAGMIGAPGGTRAWRRWGA